MGVGSLHSHMYCRWSLLWTVGAVGGWRMWENNRKYAISSGFVTFRKTLLLNQDFDQSAT